MEVTSTVTPLPRNRVGVSFDVFEGSVARIQEIRFVGNKAFSESDLLDEMKLTTPGWLTWYTDTDKYSRESSKAIWNACVRIIWTGATWSFPSSPAGHDLARP